MIRQLTGDDRVGLRDSARSANHEDVRPRTRDAERVVPSVCPYCAVGCGQRVFVKDGKVTKDIEYLSAIEESKYVIAQANAELDKNGKFVEELIDRCPNDLPR